MWYAESIVGWFPQARFLAIERNPFATVSSMLLHSGVSEWQSNWRRFGVPNEFLGITEANVDEYEQMSGVQRAALRWRSHHDRLLALQERLGSQILLLNYDDMYADFDSTIEKIWAFTGLSSISSSKRPNPESLDIWRSRLTDEQVARIVEITGCTPN